MDPLSLTANTVAIVGFAGQSCLLLYDFLRTVSEAPKEIQQHVAALKALSSTFAGIQALGQHMPAELAWSSEFRARLGECMADFQATEIKLKMLNEHLEKGRMRRTWTRVKWSSSDHYLRKFFTRVQAYHTTFSLDLLTLHIKMSLPRPAETSSDDGTQQGFSQIKPSSSESASVETRSTDGLPSKSSFTIIPSFSGLDAPAEIKAATSTEIEMVQRRAENTKTVLSHARPRMLPEPTHRCLQSNEEHQCRLTAPESVNQQRIASAVFPNTSQFDLGKWLDVDTSLHHPSKTTAASLSSSYTPQLLQFLQHQAEPVSIRSSTCHLWEVLSMKGYLWLGPVFVQRWNMEHQKPLFQATKPSEGYGAAFTLTCRFGKATFAVYFVRKHHQRLFGGQSSIAVQWNLSFARQVRSDAEIVRLARAGDIMGMKMMFQKGRASPSDVTLDGTSLLHIAAKTNHIEMVKFLIQNGANVNASDEDGETPLHIAVARAKDYNVSRVLLENGADIMHCNIDGKTPLHTFFNDVVSAILQCHSELIDGEVRDNQGMTLLHFVAWSSKSESRVCRQFIKRCCSTDSATRVWSKRDNEGRSALHLAAQRGNAAMIRYFLELAGDNDELDVDCKDRNGRTPLSYAAETKRSEVIIEMLRGRGAKVRDADYTGRTVLHHAALRNNLAAVENLVALGYVDDVRLADNDGATPIQLACQRGATAVVKYLQSLRSTAMVEKDAALCNDQSRNVVSGICAMDREAQLQQQSPYTSEDQDPRGTLRNSLINCLLPRCGRFRLAGYFILMVFAVLLWEWGMAQTIRSRSRR